MRAIVTGVSGQDGHFVARALLQQGHEVIGLTSDPGKIAAIRAELPDARMTVEPFDFARPNAIAAVVARTAPDAIFNLAARATGQGMFDAPLDMARLNGWFVLEILEAIRHSGRDIRFCQASSAEMYGDVDVSPQDERTPFRPKSPYGAAKLYAHTLVGIYRQAFGLRCCSAILYNHESLRRSDAFVTRKIAHAAAAIRLGRADVLNLGSIDALRDWGYAPEYAQAMIRMAAQDVPRDYVIATGRLTSVAEVCDYCFRHVGLDYRDFIRIDAGLKRAVQTVNVCGDPTAIARDLGWSARIGIEQILVEMVEHDLRMPDAHVA